MCLCGAQPRDTNYKPISSLPPPSLPPPAPMHRRWNRGAGGAGPPGFKVDPLLNASPSFGSMHLINSTTPQVKFPSAPSALPFPSLPSSPPPPSPLYRPLLNASPSLGSIHLINSAPQVKCSAAPLPRLSPPSRPLFNASPSLGSIHLINSALR